MRPTRVRALLLACVVASSAMAARAEVVRLEITSREPMNNGQTVGAAGPFEIIRGKIHGEIDPRIRTTRSSRTSICAPRNARGKVEYVATFALAKPVDHGEGGARAALSGRQSRQRPGGRRARRATSRSSAAGRATSSRPRPTRRSSVPVAKNPDGRRSPAGHRAVLRRPRRRDDRADPARLARHAAAVSARRSRRSRGDADVARVARTRRRQDAA